MPIFPSQIKLRCRSEGILQPDFFQNEELSAVFHTLQCTVVLLNKHYDEKTPINGALLKDAMGFVHSNLFRLEGQLTDRLSECLRLAMTAFLATTFRLPGLYEHPCSRSLAIELLQSFSASQDLVTALPDTMQTWLTLVCLMSTGPVDEQYVRAMSGLGARYRLPWDQVRQQARRVMWIDSLHDDLGRKSFELLG